MRGIFTLLVILAVVGTGGWYWYRTQTVTSAPRWNTAKVEHGNIDLKIRSTGTIEPEEVVDVGAQVVGMVTAFGVDKTMPNNEIYWGSKVDVGTQLAFIDDSIYKAQLALANANLESAVAKVASAKATLKDNAADYERAKITYSKNAISKSDLDAAEAAFETAKANVDVANATVDQDNANLELAKTNEKYCTITSPVKGTIVDRRVNIGQTVVASLSAPSLFLIAQDLTRLQIWASVNEADIGHIHAGQVATFTVDAFGDRVFTGKVLQVRLNATMNQNVVTYTVVVNTDNSDNTLLPYGTATIEFDAGRHDNVLLVPNAALQWRPVGPQLAFVAPESRAGLNKGHGKPAEGTPSPASPNSKATTKSTANAVPAADTKTAPKDKLDRGTLWVYDGEWLRPVHVKIGVTDQVNTEITSGDVKDGDQVVTGEDHSVETSDASENPFAPKMFNKKK
jgi:HlyD family secretion protein